VAALTAAAPAWLRAQDGMTPDAVRVALEVAD
jgi:hypothetical protein